MNRDDPTWRAPRTVDAERKNRRDASVTRTTDLWRRRGERSNVEAEWSEGWPPRMAQHGLHTLKGHKTSREADRIRLTAVPTHGEGNDGRTTDPARTTADARGLSKGATKVRGQARRLHAEALRDRTPEPVGEAGHQKASQPTADDERTKRVRSAQANKADHVECGYGKGWVRSAHECDEAKAVMSFALNAVRR